MTTAPAAVEQFFRAANEKDSATLLTAFAANAVLYNGEEGTYRGHAGIQFWNDKEFIGAQCAVEIQHTTITGSGEVIIAGDTRGNFPGERILLHYHFLVDGDQITTLTIHH